LLAQVRPQQFRRIVAFVCTAALSASGLSINVMYTVDAPTKRAVGFKLSEGMEVPVELGSRFKFAR
jgi:hypothetical protein